MRIRITHDAGVADYPKGAVVDVNDYRAQRLIRSGYAVAAPAEPKKRKE